jgi:hypothetical protein
MNQREFEADLRRQGYQVFYGGLQPGMVNPDHAHDWDARVMVIGGEITLTRDGKAETFRVGTAAPLPPAKFTPSMSVRRASPTSPGAATQSAEHGICAFGPVKAAGDARTPFHGGRAFLGGARWT